MPEGFFYWRASERWVVGGSVNVSVLIAGGEKPLLRLRPRRLTDIVACARSRPPRKSGVQLLDGILGAAERDVVAFSFAAIFASFDTLSIALIRLLAASLAPGLAQRALAAS
jgi:hypothetical protein